jgi:glycyl-tRNA synthetase
MIANDGDKFKKVISHAKEYGYIFPGSEIYDGLGAVYDYGPYGSLLKSNVREYWWKSMVQMHDNITGIDAAILMHPTTWKASGHVDAFNDPLIDNKDSKKRYRADQLIEDYIDKLEAKAQKEITKAAKRFGDSFDEAQFVSTNPRVLKYRDQQKEVSDRMTTALADGDMAALKQLIEDCEIADPESGSRNWTDVRQFNLMFSTRLGSVADAADTIYLRPETAQGIFVNFLNVQKTTRQKIPFGIAQVGKAFRNEIVARQFIFRMREFEQMEMQFFVRPGDEMKWYDYWKEKRMNWHKAIGTDQGMLKFKDHENLAHYANAAVDIEFCFPFGFRELEGIHSRTDYDLGRHQEFSGKKLQYFDPELEKSYVPYVVETSIGLDRMFLAMLCNAYDEEQLDNDSRTVLKFHPSLAPVKAAVLPLVKKDGLPEKAMELFDKLKFEVQCQYDEKDSIGKRYRRQDAIGTPFCITVDHQSKEDDTVTIRDRDTMHQERVPVNEVIRMVHEKTSMLNLLKHGS